MRLRRHVKETLKEQRPQKSSQNAQQKNDLIFFFLKKIATRLTCDGCLAVLGPKLELTKVTSQLRVPLTLSITRNNGGLSTNSEKLALFQALGPVWSSPSYISSVKYFQKEHILGSTTIWLNFLHTKNYNFFITIFFFSFSITFFFLENCLLIFLRSHLRLGP